MIVFFMPCFDVARRESSSSSSISNYQAWRFFVNRALKKSHKTDATVYSMCVCIGNTVLFDDISQRTPVVHSLTSSASATVALVLLFLPKVYIIIFKPEKNNRSAFTTTRDVRCHIGRTAGLSHSFSMSNESFDRSV